VHLEPESRPAKAHLGEVGSLATIADERWLLVVDFVYAFDWSPHENVGGAGADILRVAMNAAFGNVDEASALDGCGRSSDRGRGLNMVDDESDEENNTGEGEFAGTFPKAVKENGGKNNKSCGENEGRRNVAQILPHPYAES
jgi:hypothetical protein